MKTLNFKKKFLNGRYSLFKKSPFNISLLSATLALTSIQYVLPHGTVVSPPSRVWNCFKENPENPSSAACKAAVIGWGTQAFYDWSEVARMDAGGNHRAILGPGNLASAGRPDKYGGLDQVRSDWVATNVSPGPFIVTWMNSAPHKTLYYDVYITKADWTPDMPLTWDNIELLTRTGPREANATDDINVTLPLRTGKHIIFSVWQRSLTPEAFYSTSDVDFGNAPSINMPPEANFEFDSGICGGSKVNFDASDSYDPNGDALTYTWNFGDGTMATGIETSHTFAAGLNSSSVTLTVSDNTFTNDSTIEVNLIAKVDCTEPLCAFDTPRETALSSINANYENIFVLGENGPNLDNVTNFTINWSLANNGLYQLALNTSNGIPTSYLDLNPISTHNFDTTEPQINIENSGIDKLDGSYYVTLDGGNLTFVSLNKGFTIYFSKTATNPECKETTEPTPNTPPIAKLIATPAGETDPFTISFDASGTTDVDGDTLTYRIEYGNGKTGAKLNKVSSYTYTEAGEYTVTLVVSDERGGIDTDSITVTVEASGGVLSTPTFEEAEQLIFKIFPNPATTSVSIQNNTSFKGNLITVLDLAGNVVKTLTVQENTKTKTIDISSISSGLYLIAITDYSSKSNQVLKLIVK